MPRQTGRALSVWSLQSFRLSCSHYVPFGLQVALVPHTDRTSAFYLAMIRAAEAVSGLVRSASRPEMALLVSGGALAKGAMPISLPPCRAQASGRGFTTLP